MTRARRGYAQARVAARYARRPVARDFVFLEASRDAAHFQEALRTSALASFAEGLGPAVDADGLELRIRDAWRRLTREVGAWHDEDAGATFDSFAVYPDLVALEFLRGPAFPPDWLANDPWLGPVARAPVEGRVREVVRRYGGTLGDAFAAGEPLARAWQRDWRERWTTSGAPRRFREPLARLLALAHSGMPLDAPATATALERLYRQAAQSAAAGLAYLTLIALALARLRGGHAARLIAPGEAA